MKMNTDMIFLYFQKVYTLKFYKLSNTEKNNFLYRVKRQRFEK